MQFKVAMKLRTVIVIFILTIPFLGWAFIKPTRLLLPSFNGVFCLDNVCVEIKSLYDQASTLYQSSFDGIDTLGFSVGSRPIFVYCSTIECYHSFGGSNERAISYPYLGTVIAPNSWQQYISQHELVHWLQFNELGAVSTMLKPEWFREGMAYSFSQAPKEDVPENYKLMLLKYQIWEKQTTTEKFWDTASSL